MPAGSSAILAALFGTEAANAVFDDRARLQGMLDFEAALAVAEAGAGVIPADAVEPIAEKCVAALYDLDDVARETAIAGNPAIPMVKMLTAAVAEPARGYVHWGATSQDAIDTGFMLQARRALGLIDGELVAIAKVADALAAEHAGTVMAGRTFLQHALPITFGLKAAGWLAQIGRVLLDVDRLRRDGLALQFGGGAGTLASLGERGPAVAKRLADDLGLALPELPWHGARDRVARIAATLGLVAGALGKIADDVALLMQTEVGEASEPPAPGKGGSSTMPHKRNPVGATLTLAAVRQVHALVPVALESMVGEQERSLGGWHAEWATLPEMFRLTAAAGHQVRVLVEGLEVDAARMRANLDLTHGLVMAERMMMALADALGRLEAHHVVEAAARRAVAERTSLADALAADPDARRLLGAAEIAALADPTGYLGATGHFIASARARWREIFAATRR
jgi:3-carboxy-cis,cis-muconate cycloisomerase